LSPEVIQSKGHGKSVDWWALGVLIYEMSCGFPPFYANSPFAIYEKIVEGRISFPLTLPDQIIDVVRKLCTKDLSARLGNTRGGGEQVMAHPFFDGINWQELESQGNPVFPPPPTCLRIGSAELTVQGPIIPKLRHPGDTRYFDQYDPPTPTAKDEYTKEMFEKHDASFCDF
jgi:protein kinase A